MTILGVSTSARTASVALYRDGALVSSRAVTDTRRHAETVAPLIESVLAETGVAPGALTHIAVDVGPGSFTGVRIGVCIANGIALALGIPVISVCALEAIAYKAALDGTARICALIDAGGGKAYAATYENGICVSEPAAVEVDSLTALVTAGTLFAGDGALAYESQLRGMCSGLRFSGAQAAYPSADAVCRIAASRPETEAGTAAPSYLRPSQAERLRAARKEVGKG